MLRVGLSLPLPQAPGRGQFVALVVCVCAAAVLIRLGVGLYPYSGAGSKPQYGDYEAQRHWMEITTNLPPKEWYVDTYNNPLQYWGLDYPPLTAYHSWLLGQIAKHIDSSWVALYHSRGTESYKHKLFMRYSVIATDLLVFFPAVFFFVYVVYRTLTMFERLSVVFLLLISPSLVLIDHGHFQYNCASLGLFLWGAVFAIRRDNIQCCILFTLALNFKQMELYHSIPFFCFLLGRSLQSNWWSRVKQVTVYSLVVIFTFVVCWSPFLWDGYEYALPVLDRIFPVSRGLYEDKVANFWCTISPLVKFKEWPRHIVIAISIGLTLLGQALSAGHLVFYPSPYRFLLTLVNSSLAFFLFSFHVHEKSILLVSLPVALLSVIHPFLCTWFAIVATFSMYPLLVKDGLALPCWILIAFFYLCTQLLLPYLRYKTSQMPRLTIIGFYCSLLLLTSLCGLSHLVTPPERYPDLFPVLISSISFVHFAGFLVYFTHRQLTSQVTSSTTGKYQNVSKVVQLKKTQ